MNSHPHPPLGAPAPPPFPVSIRSRRFRFWIWTVGLISVLYVGVILGNAILVQRNKAYTVEAHGNLRAMSCAFSEFDMNYGKFPDASTAASVRGNTGSVLPLGTKSANDYFRQLIASEIGQGETMFYAEIPGAKKPDNHFGGTDALEKGECGFSYILGQSSKANAERPLAVTPLIHGSNRFDPKPFNGYAIVLRIGGCWTGVVNVLPINSKGEVLDTSGKHILDRANPIWGGEKPMIAWPEM